MDPSRINLRPFNLSDADDVLAWCGDDRITRHGEMATPTTRDHALSIIERLMTRLWVKSICIDDRSIGFLGVRPNSTEVDDEKHLANIGYAIGVEYWGQGIMTRSIKLAMPQMFKDLPGIVRVQALTGVENKASQRVLEKVGFTREGLLRKYVCIKGEVLDAVVYSMLSTNR